MKDRFNPTPDVTYAQCMTCGIELADKATMREHFAATMSGEEGSRRSHQARVTNPTREERIEIALDQLASDALRDFVDEAWDLLDEGATEEEVTAAVRSLALGDFADAWARREE